MEELRIGLARKLARDLLKKSGVKKPPTSLRVVIECLQKDYNYNLAIFLNSTLGNNISGILITIEGDKQTEKYNEIHYNQNHNWYRRRFTIAHEIGHLLLNTSCDESFLNFDSIKKPIEIEANQFAAELLVPLFSIKKDLRESSAQIPDLAWKYIVSQKTMGWKISSCNLLGRL